MASRHGESMESWKLVSKIYFTHNPASWKSHSSGQAPSQPDFPWRALTSNSCSSLRVRRQRSYSVLDRPQIPQHWECLRHHHAGKAFFLELAPQFLPGTCPVLAVSCSERHNSQRIWQRTFWRQLGLTCLPDDKFLFKALLVMVWASLLWSDIRGFDLASVLFS